MNRCLLILAPDRQATILAFVLSGIAFLLGLIDMASRDFAAARIHLHLSVGIVAFLFILRYVATRATYAVAESAHTQLHAHIERLRQAPRPRDETEAEQRARERLEMAELAGRLKQALAHIAPDAPARTKYEATLELMHRTFRVR